MINYLQNPARTANLYFGSKVHLDSSKPDNSGEISTSRIGTLLAAGACSLSLLPEIAHVATGVFATIATLGLSEKIRDYSTQHNDSMRIAILNICYSTPLIILNTNAKAGLRKAVDINPFSNSLRDNYNAVIHNEKYAKHHVKAIAHSIAVIALCIPYALTNLAIAAVSVPLSFVTLGTKESINATARISISLIIMAPTVLFESITTIVACTLKGIAYTLLPASLTGTASASE